MQTGCVDSAALVSTIALAAERCVLFCFLDCDFFLHSDPSSVFVLLGFFFSLLHALSQVGYDYENGAQMDAEEDSKRKAAKKPKADADMDEDEEEKEKEANDEDAKGEEDEDKEKDKDKEKEKEKAKPSKREKVKDPNAPPTISEHMSDRSKDSQLVSYSSLVAVLL